MTKLLKDNTQERASSVCLESIEARPAFRIIKRNGMLDLEIPDGKYHVKAEITLEDGKIKYIDNSVWSPL